MFGATATATITLKSLKCVDFAHTQPKSTHIAQSRFKSLLAHTVYVPRLSGESKVEATRQSGINVSCNHIPNKMGSGPTNIHETAHTA